jgi:hypothetical protein
MSVRKAIIGTMLFTLALSSIGIVRAYNDFDFNDHGNDRGRGGQRGNKKIVLKENVEQNYSRGQVLPIRKILGMGKQYKGYKLEKLVLFAKTKKGRGHVLFTVNGYEAHDSGAVETYIEPVKFFPSQGQNILGKDIKKLQVEFFGKFYVQSVKAVLKKKRFRAPKVKIISAQVDQRVRNNEIGIARLLKLRKYSGKKLKFIEIMARGGRRGASAQLLVNGQEHGQSEYLDSHETQTLRFSFYGNNTIGEDLRKVRLAVDGGMFIESVSAGIQVMGGSGPSRPVQPRTITKHLYETVSGSEKFNLSALADLYNSHQGIASITLQIQNEGRRGQVRLCEESYSFDSSNCQYTERLQRGQNTVTFIANGQQASEIALIARGQMTIKKVTIKFDR